MKPWYLFGMATSTLLLASTAALLQPPAGAQQTVGWVTDLEAARSQSRQTGKPMFVAFRCER